MRQNRLTKTFQVIVSLVLIGFALNYLSPSKSAVAQSSTITVFDATDAYTTSTCTLRDAILTANTLTAVGSCSAPSTGTVTIGFSTLISTITLNSSLGELPIGNATTTRNITINGPITINGNNGVRIFYVAPNSYLTLNNVSLTNGFAQENLSQPQPSTCQQPTQFSQSPTVYPCNGNGGALYNDGGVLSVTGGTFTNNSTAYTYGAYHAPPTDSPDTDYGDGGAIYARSQATTPSDGNVVLSGVDFEQNGNWQNKATNTGITRYGGAVFVDSQQYLQQGGGGPDHRDCSSLVTNFVAQITQTKFNGNSALDGGAIGRKAGCMQVNNDTFTTNTAIDVSDALLITN